jgi:hypothetical protein
MLELNDVQSGVLDITFKLADEQGSAAARSRRSPLDPHARFGEAREVSQRTALSARNPLPPFKRGCSGSRTTAANNSSASLHWSSPICCGPT